MDDTRLQQFVELFVRNQNRIYRFIMTLIPNRTDADDLFQQTSLTLWKTWARYDSRQDFVKWACGIAHNEVRNHLRKVRGRNVLLSNEMLERLAALRLEHDDCSRNAVGHWRVVWTSCPCATGSCSNTTTAAGKQSNRSRTPAAGRRTSCTSQCEDPRGASHVRHPDIGGRSRGMNEQHLFGSDIPAELRDLTDQMCSGVISAAGRDRLRRLLQEGTGNLYFYLIYMDMSCHLQWEFRVGLPAGGAARGLRTRGR